MRPVAIKVDEDLPAEVATILRSRGYDAQTVLDQGWVGVSDEQLWDRIQGEQRCLLTADKGFGDVRKLGAGTHAGVVLFRLPQESRAGYVRLTEQLLAAFDLDRACGAIVVVSPSAIRVRRGE